VIFLFRQMIRISTFYFSGHASSSPASTHLADPIQFVAMLRSYLKAAHAVQKRLDVFMWDFDLRELNGDDLRRDPLNVDARQRARASGAGLAIE
jgi:hypothetical protein